MRKLLRVVCKYGIAYHGPPVRRTTLYHALLRKRCSHQVSRPMAISPLAHFSTTTSFDHPPRRPRSFRRTHKMRYDHLVRRTDQLIQEASSPNPSKSMSADDCYHALESWINVAEQRKDISSAHRAADLLSALEHNLQGRRRTVLVPRTSYYDVVLQAYAVCDGQTQAAEAAENILDRMVALCRAFVEDSPRDYVVRPCEPSVKSWNIVINTWAKSGDYRAGERAEAILSKMEEWNTYCEAQKKNNPRFLYLGNLPTERTLTGILDAWSQSGHPEAPERASNLLHRIVESKRLGEERYDHIMLDPAVFNSCIAAWSRSSRGRAAATKAEGILRLMTTISDNPSIKKAIVPNARTYTMVLSAWAQCERTEGTGDAARRAESILNQMIRLYEQGSPVKPNVLAFTTCITAWARSKVRDAPERAELLLRRLSRLYSETGDPDFKPDTVCGNAVVSAWARAIHRPDSVEKAFAALQRMKSFCEVNMIGYSTLLDALQKKGLADQSLALLDTIEQASDENDKLVPTVIEYNTVLSALARCGRPEEAEKLLAKMDRLAAIPERYLVKPDKLSFTIAIDAWSRSKRTNGFQKALLLLEEMLKRYRAGEKTVKPDQFTFSILMKLCLRTGNTDAERAGYLDKALEVFRIEEFGKTDHIGYALLLLVIAKQANRLQKERLLESVFEECKAAGMVSLRVVDALRDSPVLPASLEAEWSKNVPRQEWP